jgi:hypothetical protein
MWTAVDGNFHAITGMLHEDIVSHAYEGGPWSGTLELLQGPTILLSALASIRLDNHEWRLLSTPLGPVYYGSYSGTFHWMLESGIWSGSVSGYDFYVDGFDAERGIALGQFEDMDEPCRARVVEFDPVKRMIFERI